MEYSIAIPSYKRSKICNNLTLKCLNEAGIDKSKINVFVIEEEYEEYLNTLNPEWYNKLVIGKKGIIPQREFIENYYPAGDKIIQIDDDFKLIDLTMSEYKSLDEFFKDAFVECEKEGSFIWSVYPVFNPYFRENRKRTTTGLTYICGGLMGIINRPNDEDLKIQISRDTGNKEDFERSILYWLKDKKLLRYNKISFRTKCYGTDGGGLGTLKQRLEEMKIKSILLNEKYPDITKIKIRKKTGLYEVVLKEVKKK